MDAKVKKALEDVKNIKVGCMVLNDLFGEELCIIEQALNEQDKKLKEYQEGNKTLGENLRLQNIEIGELKGANNALSQDLEKTLMFKKFVCQGVLCAMEQNHYYLQLHLTPELKDWCEKEMNHGKQRNT